MKQVKSKKKVKNLDGVNAKDAHALCRLKAFDLITYNYTIECCKEMEKEDEDGNITTHIKVVDTMRGKFSEELMQDVYSQLEVIPLENINDKIDRVITNAFISTVCNCECFGLNKEEWEEIK